MSAGGEILTGQQEEHAREIATQQVSFFVLLLLKEIGSRAVRHDGALNARDLVACIADAHRRFNEGEVVL